MSDKKYPRWSRELREWAWVIGAYLVLSTCVVQAYVIPSGSMEGTLLVGDHLLVDRVGFSPSDRVLGHFLSGREIRRSDVVCFRFPLDESETYVKRVIGVPGDRIRIADKQVWVNGEPLEEPYKVHAGPAIDGYRDNFPAPPVPGLSPRAAAMLRDHVREGELVVPEGSLFVLGDNRDNSLDSRYWGFVPRENVVGRPLMIYWSYDAPGERLLEFVSLDHLLDLARHFVDKTRWERTFRTVPRGS